MKKNKKIITIVFVLLLLLTLVYKGVHLYLYNIKNITDYEEISDGLIINDSIHIENKNFTGEYLTFNDISFQNDFKNFEKSQTTSDFVQFVSRDENKSINASFSIRVNQPYVDSIKSMTTAENKSFNSLNKEKILENNNIKNDFNLINFIVQNKDNQNNFFTSTKRMKENFFFQYISADIFPLMDSIHFIGGKYDGYVFNYNNMKIVNIIKNNKRYTFLFTGTYFSSDYVNEFLSTLIIK
ncbi:MAG: hypothetical protein PHN72_06275 [Bacilli bacterium]|nr:hypothetical protein [Bacilli bacterium]